MNIIKKNILKIKENNKQRLDKPIKIKHKDVKKYG